MAEKKSSISKTAVWILLGLLIVGLAGFGAGNVGGNVRTIGKVGDKPITTQAYFLAMQRELSALRQQTGQTFTFAQAREFGLDRAVLNRLVTSRALDHEATEMGLSIGDENVRDQVLNIPAFQGLDGQFDREAYQFALQNQGMSVGEFETTLREDSARTMLQGAVINGVSMPATYADTIVAYAGEQRDFTWTALDISALDAPLAPASDADLRAFYDANTDQFTLPITKRITYAWVTPDMLMDEVEIDEATLRQAYDERIDEFVQPERRLVERLVYLDESAAAQAKASLEVAGTTFDALVADRGLTLADVDLGDVGRSELDDAGEAVFGADVGDVVGPLPSSLGPALFRINGVLPANSISFDDAKSELRESVALQAASRLIEAQAESYDDLLAGGATLEDLVAETDLVLNEIDWTPASGEDIAAYEGFREAATGVTLDDFPAVDVLEDGSVYAMRLEEELPQRPEPFEDAREAVRVALEIQRTQDALEAAGADLARQITQGSDFATLGLTAVEETGRTRGAFIPQTPPTFLRDIFMMSSNDVQVIAGSGLVTIVQLNGIAPPAASDEAQQLRDALQAQIDQSLAQDIFDVFTRDVTQRAEQRIDPQAVEAVNANF
ncbi:MAG: SurA N-terminal domain-containing protein [Paracoccaceae bacterium]